MNTRKTGLERLFGNVGWVRRTSGRTWKVNSIIVGAVALTAAPFASTIQTAAEAVINFEFLDPLIMPMAGVLIAGQILLYRAL